MRLTTGILYGLFTGFLLTTSPSTSIAGALGAYIPPTSGQAFVAVGINNSTINSMTDPSFNSGGNTAITVGKHPAANFTYNGSFLNESPPYSNYSMIMNANKDPSINYQLSVTNNSSSTQFYLLAIGIDITPQSVNSDFQNDLTVTTSGSGSISLSPTYDGVNSSSGLQRELLSSDGGATFNAANEFGPLGQTMTSAGTTTYSFSQDACDSSTPPPPPPETFNYLELLVEFNLSAGTTVTFNGSESLAVCPEPSTLILAFIAAFMFVLFNVRSRVKRRVS